MVSVGRQSPDWILYPNPARTDLVVQFSRTGKSLKEVSIVDMSGKRVFSKMLEVTDGKINIHLGTVPAPGIYNIRVNGLGRR